ncbi:MAG: CBS domain-containing protein [Canidatus Methanoxibalbensis ujae]|nr:CBS domain-containing protein [Candidatus Methanoxibalbensis ujae]MCW7079318.1 CBS domain-containing protein [Candidatus Methanoxibalbensis ujae]
MNEERQANKKMSDVFPAMTAFLGRAGGANMAGDVGVKGCVHADKKNLRVADIMVRDVAYVSVPGTRAKILEVFRNRQISGVPVVKEGRVVGVVTRSDLLRKPEEEQIALLMRKNPVTVSPDVSIEEAANLMLTHGIRRLPVVVGDEELVGIISVADIVKVIADMECEMPVRYLLRGEAPAVWDEMPLPVAGRIMELAGWKAAAVINREMELVGIITDQDLINAAVVSERTEHSDLSLGADEDEWTWEGMRDALKIYYSVSKIELPRDKKVRDVMIHDVVTATKSSTVSECARKMHRGRFDQIPIVSSMGKLLDMLFDRDLLRIFFEGGFK